MFRFLKQVWNTVSLLGTQEEMEFHHRRRVVLTNRISLLVALLAFLTCFTFLAVGDRYFAAFMCSMLAVLFFCVPMINQRGYFLLVRTLICTIPPTLFLLTTLVTKINSPESTLVYQYFLPKYAFIVTLVIPAVIFDYREKRYRNFSLAFVFLLMVLFDPLHILLGVDAVQMEIMPDSRYYFTNIAIILLSLAILGSIMFLQGINQNHENTILKLLNEQKTITNELRGKEHTLSEAFKHLQAAEEDMRRNTHLLEEEIRQRKEKEKELVEERKRAEAAAKAKEDFLSMMSHEIRTPMNAVIGMTHLLIEDNPKPEQDDNLRILQLSAENLLSLVNDILDFNKIEAGKVIMEEVEFDLEELLLNIKSGFVNQAKQKQLALRMFLDPGIPRRLLGDPIRISQILYNLISNAIKFTEKGNVTISVKSMEEDDDSVTLKCSVADTGIGIAQDKLEAIFESFVQENMGTTRKFGGSGLGLSIVKRLLELMDSKIIVRSQQGKGSEFSFVLNLPISKLAAPEPVAKPTAAVTDLEGLRILVVEDNVVNQMVIRKFLRKWNANMDTANNGVEALKKVEVAEYDLILMDLQMPEMDGFTTTKKLRAMRSNPIHKIPIIALTASVQLDAKHKVFEVGMDDFVTKPFNPEELINKIKKHTTEE